MSPAFAAFARRFAVLHSEAVIWGEMDAYAHVNNRTYFRYFETGRMLHFQQLVAAVDPSSSFDRQGFLSATAVGPILRSTSCRFRVPLTVPDVVCIGSSIPVAAVAADRFSMSHAVFSLQAGCIAADGVGEVVTYDYATRAKTALPAPLSVAIAKVEARAEARTDAELQDQWAHATRLLQLQL